MPTQEEQIQPVEVPENCVLIPWQEPQHIETKSKAKTKGKLFAGLGSLVNKCLDILLGDDEDFLYPVNEQWENQE